LLDVPERITGSTGLELEDDIARDGFSLLALERVRRVRGVAVAELVTDLAVGHELVAAEFDLTRVCVTELQLIPEKLVRIDVLRLASASEVKPQSGELRPRDTHQENSAPVFVVIQAGPKLGPKVFLDIRKDSLELRVGREVLLREPGTEEHAWSGRADERVHHLASSVLATF
jgi:hypothetical protein